jgi:hypothetical protein
MACCQIFNSYKCIICLHVIQIACSSSEAVQMHCTVCCRCCRIALNVQTSSRNLKRLSQVQMDFRYSAKERASSEAFQGLQKSQFRSSKRNEISQKNLFYKQPNVHKTESVLSSAKCFENFESFLYGREFRVFSFYRRIVPNRMLRVFFYFCSTVWNSEHFSIPRNGMEQNSKSFLFRGTICFVYSLFRGIFFCREFPTLSVHQCRRFPR